MASGAPVLCSRNAGIADFVREGVNGWLFDPLEPGALLAQLRRCLDERARLAEMRPAAHRTAAEWTWAHFRGEWFRKVLSLTQERA